MSKKIGSMTDFYEWVKARDPSETYNYFDTCDCAIARYCRERGVGYDANPRSILEHAAQQEHYENPKEHGKNLTMGNLRREIEEHFLCPSLSL